MVMDAANGVALFILFFILLCSIAYVLPRKKYRETQYYQATKRPYLECMRRKGFRSEYTLSLEALRGLPDGKIAANSYIPKGDGEFSEVDVVLVHTSGVYVFENKGYHGWIFGNEKDARWTQMLNKNSKYRFYNPVKQNRTHMKVLAEYFHLDDSQVAPVIAFANSATLKKITSESAPVLNHAQVAGYLKDAAVRRGAVLSADEVAKIHAELVRLANVSDEFKRAHVKRIEDRYRRKGDKVAV